MKQSLALAILVFSFSVAKSQNKTFSVGTATPNVNAALHVESPTANQGFLMPRLTTTQRVAMAGLLTNIDEGLSLYDTDLNAIYIWKGTVWDEAGNDGIQFPYADTISNTATGTSLFRLVNSGTTAGQFGVAAFENTNPNTSFSTLFATTSSSINGVADFVVNNPANNNDGIGVTTLGIGTAGRFRVSNTAGLAPAIWAETNSNQPLSAAIYGLNTGTGDAAGAFRISNTASGFPAVYAETNGTSGTAVTARHLGTNGNAAFFLVNDIANGGSGMYARTNGTGTAVSALTTGTGSAGNFETTNTTQLAPTLNVVSPGTTGGAPGSAGKFEATGTGRALTSEINNAANTSRAFSSTHAGLGRAGHFETTNTGNTEPTILVQSNGANAAIRTNHTSSGIALEVINGGVRLSVSTISTPSTIDVKAGIYNITTTGIYTLGTSGRVNGEMAYITSEVGGVTVNGLGDTGNRYSFLNEFETKVFIFVGGSWRSIGVFAP